MDKGVFQVLEIDQQLFGYENGHHLLAASRKMQPSEQRVLEILSDYSGSMIPQKFDGYLTGFPFPDSGYYALSMTWVAHELPRPGCVWTHILLIPLQVTCDELQSFSIRDLFTRPDLENSQWKSNYEKQIVVTGGNFEKTKQVELSRHASSLIYFLCSQDKKLIVSTENPEPYKFALLELIHRVGLSCFKEVTFCTGVMSHKKGKDISFSIQITGSGAAKSAWRNIEDYEVMSDFDFETNLGKTDQIIETFIEFVESLQGKDVTREKLRYLIALHESLLKGKTKQVLMNLLSIQNAFAYKEDQSIIIEKTINYLLEYQSFDSKDLLYLCVLGNDNQGIEDLLDECLIGKIANIICLKKEQELVSIITLLLDSDLNPVGELMLQQLLKQLPWNMFEEIVYSQPRIVRSVVAVNWKFAESALVWKQSYELQCDVLSAMMDISLRTDIDRLRQRDILFQIFEYSKAPIENKVYEVFSDYSITTYFHWSQQCQNDVDKCRWASICSCSLKTSISELLAGVYEDIFADVIRALSPNDPETLLISNLEWRKLIDRYCGLNAPIDRKSALSIFLLLYILENKKNVPEDIASFAFLEVHKLLEKDSLNCVQWARLSPLLPELKWHKMWDKCKRLRKAAKARGYSIDFSKECP